MASRFGTWSWGTERSESSSPEKLDVLLENMLHHHTWHGQFPQDCMCMPHSAEFVVYQQPQQSSTQLLVDWLQIIVATAYKPRHSIFEAATNGTHDKGFDF